MFRLIATIAVFGMIIFVNDVRETKAQVVTTYYAPAHTVGVIPVRRGLFGLRRGYVPVVTGTVAVPVSTYYPPSSVSTYYPPARVTTYYAPPVTTYYAPPVTTTYYAPAPVTTYYAPPPVRTYYAPAVYIGR